MADAMSELERLQLSPVTRDWIDQSVLDLYDEYCHDRIDRRAFLSWERTVAFFKKNVA